MALDREAYTKELERFLTEMEKQSGLYNPNFPAAMEGMCRCLRIARLEAGFSNSMQEEAAGKRHTYTYYDSGTGYDAGRMCQKREVTAGECIAVYSFYPAPGEPDWDAEEMEKISVMTKTLLILNGRACFQRLAEEGRYRDQQLGIFNLPYFMKTVGEAISVGVIDGLAACSFNLKRFSVINQRLGRSMGTCIMKEYVDGLSALLGAGGCVCRIAGDTFAALFRQEHLDAVQEYLKGSSIVYDRQENRSVFVETTAGYYVIEDRSACPSATAVMDRISLSLHVAKSVLRIPYLFYGEELMERAEEARVIESSFRDALEKGEFVVYYQPKVELYNYRLAGAEALCRWQHNGRLVPPDLFIPVLEQSEDICDLDFYMLEHVCRDLRRWLDEGRRLVRVSVNLSRRHMGNRSLLGRVLEIIDRYRVPHEYIEIELTETTTDVEFKDLREIVSGLQAQGVHTSVDDFGVGYSSLNLIRELSWNVLKIDKSFLPTDEQVDERKYVMFRHMVALARSLGLECIVEGVETAEQVRILKENKCYLAQGYYFDRPLPVKMFEERLAGNWVLL